MKFVKSFLFILFAVLVCKAFLIQDNDSLKEKYENRIYRTEKLIPERGVIFDRDGKTLAGNRLAIDVKGLNDISLEDFKKSDGWYLDVDLETVKKLKMDFKDVEVRERSVRYYPYGRLFSLIVGYTRPLDINEVDNLQDYFRRNERLGASGIEMAYETTLRGKDGEILFRDLPDKYYEDNVILSKEDSVRGDDIHLSLSVAIQKFSWEILEDSETGEETKGVVIVGNPMTGEIYSMVSRPSYSPEGYMSSRWEDVPGSLKGELLNRATEGLYPPASTFKVVSAAAALEHMGVDPARRYNCNGSVRVGNRVFHGWNEDGLGVLDMVDSLAYSCNETFYYLAMEMPGWNRDPEILQNTAFDFGFGSKVGLPIPESSGLVPNNSWKKKNTGEPWYGGDTVMMMIGQGSLLVTPIQVFSAYQAIAKGSRLSPKLVKRIGSLEQDEVYLDFSLNDSTLDVLRLGLKTAVSEGTAARTLIDDDWTSVEGVKMSAKTGTAQTGNDDLLPHGWFVGYGEIQVSENLKKPIIVLVLAENAGMSSRSVVPKARKLIKDIRDYWRLELGD
tara:strand:+ start:392 stop:2068 length:1677 start_codon:yes stop_codon:yes gene_type:complete